MWRGAWTQVWREPKGSPQLDKYAADRASYYEGMEGFYERRVAKDSPYLVKGAQFRVRAEQMSCAVVSGARCRPRCGNRCCLS